MNSSNNKTADYISSLSKSQASLERSISPSQFLPDSIVKSIESYRLVAAIVEEATRPQKEMFERLSRLIEEATRPQRLAIEQLEKVAEELARPQRQLRASIAASLEAIREPRLLVAEAMRHSQLSLLDASMSQAVSEVLDKAKIEPPSEPLPEELLTETLFAPDAPQVTIHAAIIQRGNKTSEGYLVEAASIPWWRIYSELQSNPNFLFQFINDGHKFEEFIAGAYRVAGWTVTLTPRSGDGGRDVIAEKCGIGALRFVEQCKAYRHDRRVTAEEVRAMLGVYAADPRATKAIVTTTADFAPMIYSDPHLKQFIPNRLELRNGTATLSWLKQIAEGLVQ